MKVCGLNFLYLSKDYFLFFIFLSFSILYSLSPLANKYFSEYTHSILFYLSQKKSSVLYFAALVICVYYFNTMIFLDQIIIPILFLIIFDFILLSFIIPPLKLLLLNIKFYLEYIDKNTLFDRKDINKIELKGLFAYEKSKENYIISIPKTNDKIDSSLKNIINFLWLVRLYENRRIRYFGYILAISTSLLLFYLITYQLYYKVCLGIIQSEIKGNIYFIIFTLIWLIYSVIRLKTLAGLDFFEKFFTKYKTDANISDVLNYITIYRFEKLDNYSNPRIRFPKQIIINNGVGFKLNIEKNVDYFVAFITTVLIMVVLGLL